MTTDNAAIVREFYDFFVSGRFQEAAEKSLAEGFVLINPLPDPIPFGGRFEGVEGFLRYLGGIAGEIEIKAFEIEEVIAERDRVVVTGHEHSRVVSTGREYRMDWVHVLRLVDGRVQELREYNDTAAMRAAYEAPA